MQKVGQNPKAPFCAFGDDSAYKDVLTYAYAIFHRRQVSKAKKILKSAKKKFEIPVDTPIHCRILFSGDQRKKANLDHLSHDTVKSLISHLVEEMNQVPCLLRYSYCILPKSSEIFLKVVDEDHNIVHDTPKGVLGLLSQFCLVPEKHLPHAPGADLCEIFASQDKTKIKFIGQQKRKADTYTSGLSIEEPTKNERVRISPNVGNHELQQVADVYAYICSHAHSKACKDEFFKGQLDKVKYFTSTIAHPDSQFKQADIPKHENS